MSNQRLSDRLILIGWDGADPATLKRLLAGGRLPNLASLLCRGASLELSVPATCFLSGRLDLAGHGKKTA